MTEQVLAPMNRRSLFRMIGMAAGSAAMYQAMTDLGYAGESGYSAPLKLEGDPKGASVLVLGAGLAGLTAALELRNAGYKVQVLEYQHKAGGRNISIRGGDTVNELGGFTQHCQFDPGFYVNPGPMRTLMRRKAMPGENPEDLVKPEEMAFKVVEMLSPSYTLNETIINFQK